ncbi:MAG: thiamine-phosphate kinase, partial [bacterium]|nr:thiamine-phosphate kinase [bacterium]
LGWKSLAVNLSDIAAMGGIPQEAVVGLGIPDKATLKDLKGLYRGLSLCSQAFHCRIVGGDTNRSRSGWVLSVAVTGYCSRTPKLRRGARPGDGLWVTGSFGGSALGWEAMRKKLKTKLTAPFRKKFSRPQPRIAWGQRLGENPAVTSMMDCSDGLAGDLGHIARAGKVGLEVDLERIPRLAGFDKACKTLKVSPERMLLSGGEDYELIFTLDAKEEENFADWIRRRDICAVRIGRAHQGKGVVFKKNGKKLPNTISGFKHF